MQESTMRTSQRFGVSLAAFVAAASLLVVASVCDAATAPSVPGIDAPELAKLGPHRVGVRSLTLVQKDQLDLLAVDPKTGTVPKHDRELPVVLWYPAEPAASAKPETYSDSLVSEPP